VSGCYSFVNNPRFATEASVGSWGVVTVIELLVTCWIVALILQINTTFWAILLLKPKLLLFITRVVPPVYEPVEILLNVAVNPEIKLFELVLGLLKRAESETSNKPFYVTVLRMYVNVPTGFNLDAIGKLSNAISIKENVVSVVKSIGKVMVVEWPLKLKEFIVRDLTPEGKFIVYFSDVLLDLVTFWISTFKAAFTFKTFAFEE